MHWINVICLCILLMSGLNIFNAHPHLYWGKDSHFATPLFSITTKQVSKNEYRGVTRILGYEFDTDGVLTSRAGLMIPLSRRADFPLGQPSPARNGWPWHATGISFFAWLFVLNGVAYIAYAISSGHLRRDMIPKMLELRNIGSSIVDHIKFKHPTGEAAKRYNVLQNLAYLAVIFGLLPLVVIAGWALSPRLDVVWTGWVDLLGGRQAARTLHFLAAMGPIGICGNTRV